MSVQINQYYGYGYYLPYKEARDLLIEKYGEDKYEEISDQYHDSAFKNDIVAINGCSMIEDGMNGKYCFFGKVFEKASNGEYLETIEIKKVKKHIKLLISYEFKKLFGDDAFEDFQPISILITRYR